MSFIVSCKHATGLLYSTMFVPGPLILLPLQVKATDNTPGSTDGFRSLKITTKMQFAKLKFETVHAYTVDATHTILSNEVLLYQTKIFISLKSALNKELLPYCSSILFWASIRIATDSDENPFIADSKTIKILRIDLTKRVFQNFSKFRHFSNNKEPYRSKHIFNRKSSD